MDPHSLKTQGSQSHLGWWSLREPRQTGVGGWLVGFDQQLLKRKLKPKSNLSSLQNYQLKTQTKMCVCPPTLTIKESAFCYELTIVL